MFGLSFVQQGFLFATAAAAVPIAIHLMLKQRARRVEVGSLRFVRQLVRQQNRMRRLRQWLLLALRVVGVCLLALLFARPYWDRSAIEAGQREIVWLADRSASTQLRLTDGTSVARSAWEMLQQELRQVDSNTVVHVAAFDSQGVQRLELESLEQPLTPGFAGTDYGAALAWARDLLSASERSDQQIRILTDLQQSGVRQVPWETFPDQIKVQVTDLGQAVASNVVVERAAATRVEIRPQMPPTVVVELRNDGPVEYRDLAVSLELSGPGSPLRQDRSISLAPTARERLEFELPISQPGKYQGYVRVDAQDSLAFDNRRYLAFEARFPDRLLIVDGDEGSSVFDSETYFLEKALQTGKSIANPEIPTFETERIVWDKGQGFPDLSGFRVIVLANVRRFSPTDVQRLIQYVASGGSLLFFTGDRFDRAAAEPLAEAGLLPAQIDGVAEIGRYRLKQWQSDHPSLSPFRDPQYGDLRHLQFRTITRVTPTANARVLASTDRGWPLLVEAAAGQGRTVLMATAADREWGDWPQHRLYVPLIRQLLAYLTDQHLRQTRLIESTVDADHPEPGISVDGPKVVVRNVELAESQLARISIEDFAEQLALPSEQTVVQLTPEEQAALAAPAGSLRATNHGHSSCGFCSRSWSLKRLSPREWQESEFKRAITSHSSSSPPLTWSRSTQPI